MPKVTRSQPATPRPKATTRAPQTLQFSVDAALLRELGERLVGRPHIALAELVKNSYDADATEVILRVGPDLIEVTDNGNGMTLQEIERFWLRVGSPHKQKDRFSPVLGRPMTGSKGVGRLAMQFLAREVELRTVSRSAPRKETRAWIDWDQAVSAGELTRAEASYEQSSPTGPFPRRSLHGTSLILRRLPQSWDVEAIRRLAEEIWTLQPPFRPNPEVESEAARDFAVKLEGAEPKVLRAFQEQMTAALRAWEARIVGKLSRIGKGGDAEAQVEIVLEFAGGPREKSTYSIPKCVLHSAEFEIRVFRLRHRQGRGIRVGEARDYFKEFGGVHVYDAGFHLPYYGADTDWLNIERDHAARLSRSMLLPEALQVERGLNYLPTQRRLFGVVHVDTSREQELARVEKNASARQHLAIQVSRDRLIDNRAFENLQQAVRTAIDYYATRAALRAAEAAEARRPTEPVRAKAERISDVLERYAARIEKPVYAALRHEIDDVIVATETEAESQARQVGLLGPLATAGISALAYDHELVKQFQSLRRIAESIAAIPVRDSSHREQLRTAARDIEAWLSRAQGTRMLFAHLADEENRSRRARMRARATVIQVVDQMQVLLRGVRVETRDMDPAIRLPEGTFAEWAAIVQNVLVNAVTAMLDAVEKRIVVTTRGVGRQRAVLIQDTGVGVDLEDADRLFGTFEREIRVSADRRALGYGGTGLGLAIVRMVATNLGCSVSFVEPDHGFATAFQLSWQEVT